MSGEKYRKNAESGKKNVTKHAKSGKNIDYLFVL